MVARQFRAGGPNFVSEIIDGEAVIINLETGSYYSLAKAGAQIWEALNRGVTDRALLATLLERYEGDPAEIEQALVDLIGALESEGILRTSPVQSDNGVGPHIAPSNAEKVPFERPTLQKYTDMEAILMLDPIHEVDETGWPSAKRPD